MKKTEQNKQARPATRGQRKGDPLHPLRRGQKAKVMNRSISGEAIEEGEVTIMRPVNNVRDRYLVRFKGESRQVSRFVEPENAISQYGQAKPAIKFPLRDVRIVANNIWYVDMAMHNGEIALSRIQGDVTDGKGIEVALRNWAAEKGVKFESVRILS